MNRYASIDCPICAQPLDNGEDVVVCPECGAPYHRHCYVEAGTCVFTELHQKGESWQAPHKEEKFDGNAQLRCSRCGTVNPPSGLFCQVCGNQLNDKTENGEQASTNAGVPPFYGMGGGFPPGMPLNPFTTPFGGVAPDEVIDGIPAKDLAIFVGRNSHYYLPRFKELSTRKSKIINWAAFFFNGGFFLYRKMYGIGVLIFAISAILSLPQLLMFYQTLAATTNLAFTPGFNLESLSNLTFICSLLTLGLRLLCGLFANTLYKSHTYKKIKREQEKSLPEEEYLALLAKKGSVAIKLITGLLVGYLALSVISMYLTLLTGA